MEAPQLNEWLYSPNPAPISLPKFRTEAFKLPVVFRALVERVSCHRLGVHEYILVHCLVTLPATRETIKVYVRLGRNLAQPGADTIRITGVSAKTLHETGSLAIRGYFVFNQGSNNAQPLMLHHILEIYEYLAQASLTYTSLGTNCRLLCPGLLECLRGCRCFRGQWFEINNKYSIPEQDLQAVIQAKNIYLHDEHSACCLRRSRASSTKAIMDGDVMEGANQMYQDPITPYTRGNQSDPNETYFTRSATPPTQWTSQLYYWGMRPAAPDNVFPLETLEFLDESSRPSHHLHMRPYLSPTVAWPPSIRAVSDPANLNMPHPLRENRAGSWTPPKISRETPLSSVIAILVEHDCQDITKALDLSGCSEYPISSGGFGDIYQGQLKNGASVAIKCMRIIVDPDSSEQQKHFKATKRSDLNRPRLCMQIAEGLAFLHQCSVVHGDLKGANVLVSEAHEPLLADFGSATLQERTLQFTCTTTRNNFSLRWTAPELLDEGPLSIAADVYALGMTILEVITGQVPYAELKRDPAVMNSISNKRHPKRSQAHVPTESKHGDALWELLTSCWAFEPKSRPSAQFVQDKMGVITPEGLTLRR